MIEIKEKKDCTGCGACINACPLHIISFRED
ncbi:MAG: 4Fe-4S binding protein, partial [Aeriscardovia sp.]|nr:4Fe-4S binding protein [Aeriscardovia sp.]